MTAVKLIPDTGGALVGYLRVLEEVLLATRYFTTTNNTGAAQALARVDDSGTAERAAKGQPVWLSLPSLLHLVFGCDMNWDEVDQAGVAAFLGELGMEPGILDTPSAGAQRRLGV
jgi:hypothetical protein